MTAPHTSSSGFRGDIEGLRAVAVLAVLAYHAKLGPFQGGYIGVDVFFVVSGYLISSLLMRDLQLSGAEGAPELLGAASTPTVACVVRRGGDDAVARATVARPAGPA